MATIQQALWYHVTNTAAVQALISSRMYPAGDVPQGTALPYVTYFRVEQEHHRHYGGGSGFNRAVFSIDCYAATAKEADAVYDAVKDALDNYTGNMGEAGATVDVRGAFLETDGDSYNEPTDGSQRGTAVVGSTYVVWYQEQ